MAVATHPDVRRGAAVAAIVGAGLLVLGAFAAGAPPAPDASPAEVRAHVQDHRGAVLLGVAATATAIPVLLVVVGTVSARIRRAGADDAASAMTVCWSVAFGALLGSSFPLAAVTWSGADLASDGTIRLAWGVHNLAAWALTAPVAAAGVLLPSIAGVRRGAFPRWLAAIAVGKALTCVVELAGVAVRDGWNAGGYAGGISAPFTIAWFVGVAIVLAGAFGHSSAPCADE